MKKEEQEMMLDEDGTILGAMGLDELAPLTSSKGKRKRDRDDDNAYRPKGGSSRAPKKKKRTSGGDKESGTPGEKG